MVSHQNGFNLRRRHPPMRPSTALLIVPLLLGGLGVPLVGAEPVQVLTDEAGDAVARTPDGTAPPSGTYDPSGADLLGLTLDETAGALTFSLAVADVAPSAEGSGTARFVIGFFHADQSYQVVVYRFGSFDGAWFYDAEVEAYDAGRERHVPVYGVSVDVDEAANTYHVAVPRDVLVDGNGTAPTAGRELRLLRVTSQEASDGAAFSLGTITVADAMPDSGVSDVPYAVQRGLLQSGQARLHSDDPVRASNGEEATFVYYVQGVNLHEEDDRFDLEAMGVPGGWGVTLPAATLRIPGNDTVTFPLLVSIPFSHQHGAFETFQLELRSQRDDRSVGRLELGVRFLETPQPAGHHDTVWIHTRQVPASNLCFGCGDGSIAFMNAVEDHALDEDIPARGEDSSFIGTGVWNWDVFLEPGLRLGLDFDVNETGSLDVELDAPNAVSDASLGGRLVHYARVGDGVERTLLADLVPTTPGTLNGPTTLSTLLVPTPDADLVPYNPHAALVLELELEGDAVTAEGAEEYLEPALTGGRMTLPLFEYRDPVVDVFAQLAGLDLRHADRAEKFVNPGETVLFNLTLANEGAIDDVFELRVNGTNQEWARVLGDTRIFVGTGNERHVVVAVTPPTDAPDGAVTDLVVTVASVAEPTVQGNVRVEATVDSLVDRTDEGFLVQDAEGRLTSKESPGPAVGLLLAGLAAAALRRRR